MTELRVLPARTNTEKLEAVASVATDHFHLGHRLLILVANEKAAQFVDDLLWKIPPDSFLPHTVATHAVDQPVVVTDREENLNSATILLSLLPVASTIATQFDLIYDLDDQTSAERREQSRERRQAYLAMGLNG